MYAVIFEVRPKGDRIEEYLDIAATLRPALEKIDGFISIERFKSLTDEGKVLSLSIWRDEAAIAAWRNLPQHREAQAKGRAGIFDDYRIRVAEIVRDYSMTKRGEAPADAPPDAPMA